jgi:hypothetical protein
MHAQEISIEVPSQGARRATGEGSQNGLKKPERFSARHKIEVVLRLLRGEALDLLSRELGLPRCPSCGLARGVPRRRPGGDEKNTAR